MRDVGAWSMATSAGEGSVASIDVNRTFELLPVVLEIVESAENPQRVSELVSILCCIFTKRNHTHASCKRSSFLGGEEQPRCAVVAGHGQGTHHPGYCSDARAHTHHRFPVATHSHLLVGACHAWVMVVMMHGGVGHCRRPS